MICFSDAKIYFMSLLILRRQSTASTPLIRQSVWIKHTLHQRQGRLSLPTYNKAE